MPVTIVNVKHETFTVYIGRANRRYGLPQSKWANPFKIGPDGDRAEVIAKYRVHVQSRPDLLEALADINYARLGCWCAPEPCHGDVLAELIAERERQIYSGREEVDSRRRVFDASQRSWGL